MFLDLLDDFLGLGDSLGNDVLHDFHNFVHLDFQVSSNFSDPFAHLQRNKDVIYREQGKHLTNDGVPNHIREYFIITSFRLKTGFE